MALTLAQLQAKVVNNDAVSIGVIGDSTTCGYGANPGSVIWAGDDTAHGFNNTGWGPNWTDLGEGLLITIISYFTSPETMANVDIGSPARLLKTALVARNASSEVYNYGYSGYDADFVLSQDTVGKLALRVPKPDAVFVNIGINSAKVGSSDLPALTSIMADITANDMLPILVLGHNVGNWNTGDPSTWSPMSFWWSTYRPDVKGLRDSGGYDFLDMGTDIQSLDTTLLYDPFHPTNKGYVDIAQGYITTIGGQATEIPEVGVEPPLPTPTEDAVRLNDGRTYSLAMDATEAFKFKVSDGNTYSLPLSIITVLYTRLKVQALNLLASFGETVEIPTVPTDGLISYYPLENDAVDVVSAFNGSGSGVTYDGVSAYFGGAGAITLDSGLSIVGDSTISLWIKGTVGMPIGRYDITSYHMYFSGITVYGGYTGAYSFTLNNPTDTWSNITIFTSSTGSKMYQNGVLCTALTQSTLESQLGNIKLGSNSTGLYDFVGNMARLRFYNREITEAEALTIYNTEASLYV